MGKKVGMTRDVVNNAPAPTQAGVGFAIGVSADVVMESADVALMKSNPYDIVAAIDLSRAMLRKIHQNLWLMVGYNVISVSARRGCLVPIRTESGGCSSGSTLLVAINALVLKHVNLADITRHSSSQTSQFCPVEAPT